MSHFRLAGRSLHRHRKIALLLLLVFSLAACGKTGPLYLPDEKGSPEQGQNRH